MEPETEVDSDVPEEPEDTTLYCVCKQLYNPESDEDMIACDRSVSMTHVPRPDNYGFFWTTQMSELVSYGLHRIATRYRRSLGYVHLS